MRTKIECSQICFVLLAFVFGINQVSGALGTDPEPPAIVLSPMIVNDKTGGMLFTPLWPPYSDYYSGAQPQVYWTPEGYPDEPVPAEFSNGNPSTPIPPMPMHVGLYQGYVNTTGSALDVDPLFWKGVYSASQGGSWDFYTIEMPHVPGLKQNYHNRFQAMVDFQVAYNWGSTDPNPSWDWPPNWQSTLLNGPNFDSWVDIYAPYLSRAYFEDIIRNSDQPSYSTASFGRNGFPRVGSPQHVELPPNYPPRSTSIAASTSPIIPASGGNSHGSYLARESIADRVDMITGEPILTEIDLELPFGSAVYRRVRTYSESASHGHKVHRGSHLLRDVEAGIRGWHGMGWMSSDAPLFLFDASYSGTLVTGDSQDIGPVCYFAPDAHHSIPFIQQGGTVTMPPDYVAPEWMDAMLLYDKSQTVWNPTDGWIRPPQEMKLYMHDNSVVYTIKMYYEDVDPIQHLRPMLQEDGESVNHGNGVPYYGLVTSIEDSAGNRVEINYADPELHKPYLDPAYNIVGDPIRDAALNAQILPVRQRGWYKGMIDHVKLYASDSPVAAWSIYYTYRTFFAARNTADTLVSDTYRDEDDIDPFIDYWSSASHAPALHSLLVYDGDVDPSSDRNLILPCDSISFGPEGLNGVATPPAFVDVFTDHGSDNDGDQVGKIIEAFSQPIRGSYSNQFEYQDAVIGPTGHGGSTISVLPDTWAHQLRFSYADPAHYGEIDENSGDQTYTDFNPFNDYTLPSCGPAEIDEHYTVRKRNQAAYLLKVESKSRFEVGEFAETQLPSRYWLYRYQDTQAIDLDKPSHWTPNIYAGWGTGLESGGFKSIRRLSHRFGPDTIARIYKNRPDSSTDAPLNGFVNGMIGIDEDRALEIASGSLEFNTPLDLAPATAPASGIPFGQPFTGGSLVPYEPLDPSDPTDPDSPYDDQTAHNLDETSMEELPVGMLADSVFYRWTQAYRLDPRIMIDENNSTPPVELLARPASWEVLDGRVNGIAAVNSAALNPFNQTLRDTYVGASISAACESYLQTTIAQARMDTTGFLPGGTGLFSAIADDGTLKWYRIYRFIQAPEDPIAWRDGGGAGGTPLPISDAPRGPEVIYADGYADTSGIDAPWETDATHSIYYYPYNFTAVDWGIQTEGHPTNVPLSDPMWWTVVDEYDSIVAALSQNSSLAYPTGGSANNSDTHHHYSSAVDWKNRRVVGMNSAGLVLSDRSWDAPSTDTDDPPAILSAWSFDEHMRPIYKFSRGWGAAAVESIETTSGLVEVFEYEPGSIEINYGPPANGMDDVIRTVYPREPIKRSIRKGCEGIDVKIHEIEYVVSAPTTGSTTTIEEWLARKPLMETFYDFSGAPVGTIEHSYGYWPASTEPGEEQKTPPMRWKVRAGPVFQSSPNGSPLRAFEGEWYNDEGQLVWSAEGALVDPMPDTDGHIEMDNGSTDEVVFLSYRAYDEDGREILHVEDISNGFDITNLAYPGHPTVIDDNLPTTGLTGNLLIGENEDSDDLSYGEAGDIIDAINGDRMSQGLLGGSLVRQSESTPLNNITFRAYNRFGEYKVVHPSGMRDVYHYDVESETLRELRAMGVEFDGDSWNFVGQGLFDSAFDGGALSGSIQSTIDELLANQWDGSPYQLDSQVFKDLEVIAEITPNYDTAGRLVGITVSDNSEAPQRLDPAVSYDGWGNPLLQIEPDGKITRNRYDQLGRLHKTYLGSRDRHTRWRTAAPSEADDDMILTEKLFYGSSVNDAFLPITKWMYRARSATQYDGDWFEPSDDQSGDPIAFSAWNSADDESSPGIIEYYGYDWRMRRVSTRYEDFELDNPGVFREEHLFLDNLDRVRFRAVYAPVADAGAPDPDITPDGTGSFSLPSADDFMNSTNLVALEETVYNEAGQVEERRRYDPAGGGYLSTYSYTDHRNNAVWESSNGGDVTQTVYDAKGRIEKIKYYAGDPNSGGIEISRTVNTFDPSGHVTEVVQYDRLEHLDTTTADVTLADHRKSVSYSWFDSSGRVIASADMGSVHFVNGSVVGAAIPARVDDPPLRLAKYQDFFVGDPDNSSMSQRRILVGVDLPPSYFDANGEPLARVSCFWYDRLGKQNATLTVLSSSLDTSTGLIDTEFIIDRSEYNKYGQKVLEHQYAYTGDGSSYTSSDFELLGGVEYGYEGEVRLEDNTYAPNMAQQVRSVRPLSLDSAVMEIVWNDIVGTRTASQTGNPADDYSFSTDPAEGSFSVNWLIDSGGTNPWRATIIEYNAPVVNPDFELPSGIITPGSPPAIPLWEDDWGDLGIGNRPDLVKALHLPDPVSGRTGEGMGYSLFFFYTIDGLPAFRLDSRGILLRYIYDADGNLIRMSGDDHNMPLIASFGMSEEQLPSNAIEYTYDALSRLLTVSTGRDLLDGSFRTDTHSILDYDRFGNLLSEEQQRFNGVDVNNNPLSVSGTVSYGWDHRYIPIPADPANPPARVFDGTENINRVSSITYPARVGTHDGGSHSSRVVNLLYGTSGSIEDMLGRVTGLNSTGGPAGTEIGHVATYQYEAGDTRLTGVDLGNHPVDSVPIHKDTRSFDRFGRVDSRTVEAEYDTSTQAYSVIHNSILEMDLGGRRLAERMVQLDHPSLGSRDNTHSSLFGYDTRSRLISEDYGALDAANSAIASPDDGRVYTLDELNRRVGTVSAPGVEIFENGTAVAEQSHVLDERGAIIEIDLGTGSNESVETDYAGAITQLHGRTVFYDWLGRPVLVAEVDDSIQPAAVEPVVAFKYDGFGRVAQRLAPWPNSTKDWQRIESYYYDGVRRIQEHFHDPVQASPPWPVQIGEGLGSGPPAGEEHRTEAEFIWSAASDQPFDTCHVQIDWWDREAWIVQDHATGTVRAYTDAHGEVVKQYRFDSFGNFLNQDTFSLAASGGLFSGFGLRLGHHGLFGERVDHHTNAPMLDASPELEVWYQSRSRWYVPELGRFISSDPNATGVPVVSTLAMLGQMPQGPPSGSFDAMSHYGDGWDTWTAYGANPIMSQDPTGLFLGYVGMGVGTGLSAGLGSAANLIDVYDGYDAAAQLGGAISVFSIQQQLLLDFIDSVFNPNAGPTQTSILGAYNQASASLNFVNANGGFGFSAGSVWGLSPFQRGRVIENQYAQVNIGGNYPVIDDYRNRTVTSVKSIDLNAASYQKDSALKSTIRRHIRSLSRFHGSNHSAMPLTPADYNRKALAWYIPENSPPSRVRILEGMKGYARSQGVDIVKILRVR